MTDHDNLPARYQASRDVERRAAEHSTSALAPPHYERIPIFDLNRFELVCKIADRMAAAALCPNALCGYTDDDGKFVAWPEKQIAANCFLVVSQAMNWRMDPFALAQCVSIVRGKLMYEGKAVAAAIEANLGLRLSYTYSGDLYQTSRAVTVSGHYHDEAEPRTIMGSVEHWKTDGKATPWTPKNFDRMLAYRGAREWARRHAPGIILGIVTDDEDLDSDRRPSAPQITQESAAPAIELATGFKKAPTRRKAPAPAQEAQSEPSAAQDDEQQESGDNPAPGSDNPDAGSDNAAAENGNTAGDVAPTAAELEQKANAAWAERLHEAQGWDDLWKAMNQYAKDIGTMTETQARAIRRGTWKRMEAIAETTGEILTPSDDMNLFACFVYGCDDRETLRNVFNSAQTSEAYARMKTDTRNALKKAAMTRIEQLEAAK